MNIANKITTVRMILSFIIIGVLLFPFYQFGIDVKTFIVNGNIVLDVRYIVGGVLFIVAAISDFLDGYIARKNNIVTNYGKVMDAICDKLLVNSVLIILACNGMISTIIPVIIVIRDIFVDAIKMNIGNRVGAVGAIPVAKVKTFCLMVGIILTLFYNLPFELLNLDVSSIFLIVACILSVISAISYYNISKQYIVK